MNTLIRMAADAEHQVHYSLKISEDIVNRLNAAKQCHVELKNGVPVAIVIDDYCATFVPSQDAQRVELVRMEDYGMTIEGGLSSKLSMVPEKLDTAAIRHRTEQAEQKRSSRKTLQIEDNIPSSPAVKRPCTSSSNVTKNQLNNRTATKKTGATLEDEVIHFLALEDMTLEGLGLKLGCTPRDLEPVLSRVSVPNGLLFKLKPTLYNRIEISNWPRYSVKERQLVARRLGLTVNPSSNAVKEFKPADITRLADQRVRQMMKSTRRKR